MEKQKIEGHLKKILEDTGIFLVEVSIDRSNRILVYIDKEDGVSIEDCVQVSRALEGRLDRDQEDFELEVSSPGLDAPLKVQGQYRKNIGKMVAVQCRDGSRYTGILEGMGEDSIQLKLKVGGTGSGTEVMNLAMKDILRTNLVIQF